MRYYPFAYMHYCITFVKPGRSTKVKVNTLGEKILRLMGWGEIPMYQCQISHSVICRSSNPLTLTQILSSLQFSILDNLLSDLVEIIELLTWQVKKLAPFIMVFFRVTAAMTGTVCFTRSGRRSVDKL